MVEMLSRREESGRQAEIWAGKPRRVWCLEGSVSGGKEQLCQMLLLDGVSKMKTES